MIKSALSKNKIKNLLFKYLNVTYRYHTKFKASRKIMILYNACNQSPQSNSVLLTNISHYFQDGID